MSAMTNTRHASSVRGISKPLIAVLIGLLLLVAIGGGWLLMREPASAKPATGAGNKAKAPAGPLELAAEDVGTVELRALSRSLPLSGSLRPLVQAMVKSRVSGDLLEMRVREGQNVARGEVLARIDIRNLKAQFDSGRAGLEKARADLSIAKTNRDNSALMLKENFISKNAFDQAASTYEAAAASVRVAEAQAQIGQIGLDDAVVRAPISGVVSQRLAQPGEKVSPDLPLLAIVDLTKLELEALAPASEVPSVKPGQIGRFRVNGFGDRVFEGRVERINPVTEEGSRSIKLYLSVDNTDGALRGGMFAQGDLVLDETDPTPSIPVAAVRSEAGATYALVVEKDVLVRRPVTLGLQTDDATYVEVRSGLIAGEQVIVAPIDALKAGVAVVLKPAPSVDGRAAIAAPAAAP